MSRRRPLLYECPDPEQTLMELRMVSLFSEKIVTMLDRRFGKRFRALPELERLAVVTAATEQIPNLLRYAEAKGEKIESGELPAFIGTQGKQHDTGRI